MMKKLLLALLFALPTYAQAQAPQPAIPWATYIYNSTDRGTLQSTDRLGVAIGPGVTRYTTPDEINAYWAQHAGGDCTASAGGIGSILCAKTNGVNFGTFATQNYAIPPAIGGTTPAAGSFTSLISTVAISGAGFTNYFAAPPTIGGVSPAPAYFSLLTLPPLGGSGTQCLEVNNSGTVIGSGAGCGTGGGSVASVSGTSGQIAVSPTTGSVVVGLPSTITSSEIASGLWNFTGTFEVGGMTITFPVSGQLVGTTDTQTLSAKTLTSPVITGGTINNTPLGGSTPSSAVFTSLGASGGVTLTGLASGTQVSCLGLDSGNHLVLLTSACGSSSGGTLTVTDGTHSVGSTITLTVGGGLVVGGSGGSATLNSTITDATHVVNTALTVAGQDNFNAGSLTATVPGTGTLGAGQSAFVTDQNTATLAITDSQTVNGLLLPTVLHHGGFYGYTGNGGSADGFGFPGYDTVTTNALPKFSDATGALTASTITDAGGGIVVGSATGGAQGAGTLNATNLYVNGVAVSAGSGCTTSGSSLLQGNGSGGCGNVTVGTGLSLSGSTLTATGSGTNNFAEVYIDSTGCSPSALTCSTSSVTSPAWADANTTLKIEAVGTGGSGGGCNTVSDLGAPGGGGASLTLIGQNVVAASTAISISFGTAGAAIAAQTASTGNAGTSTTIALGGTIGTVTLGGGAGGVACAGAAALGGAGGTVSVSGSAPSTGWFPFAGGQGYRNGSNISFVSPGYFGWGVPGLSYNGVFTASFGYEVGGAGAYSNVVNSAGASQPGMPARIHLVWQGA